MRDGSAGWSNPQPWPELAADEIHLWRTTLTAWQTSARLDPLAATLALDEHHRAAQFRLPTQGAGFSIGRGLLRVLLGRYLHCPAAALRFCANAHGKPALIGPNAADWHFNLSHSGEQVIYAIAHRPVGVDLERLERRVSVDALVQRICTPAEATAFNALPDGQRFSQFMQCWTRKEASAKALGGGLASGLSTLPVCFPSPDADNGRVQWSDAGGIRWSVVNLVLDSGWIGALAARGTDWRWRGWQVPEPEVLGTTHLS